MTFPLRQYLILEIQETFHKLKFIYNRVDLCKIEKSILTGKYELTHFIFGSKKC